MKLAGLLEGDCATRMPSGQPSGSTTSAVQTTDAYTHWAPGTPLSALAAPYGLATRHDLTGAPPSDAAQPRSMAAATAVAAAPVSWISQSFRSLATHADSVIWAVTCALPAAAAVATVCSLVFGLTCASPLLLCGIAVVGYAVGTGFLWVSNNRLNAQLLREAVALDHLNGGRS